MASRDQDEAMAGLLRQSLSRGADAGNDCPEPDILAAYYERSLGHDELERYELHFSQCPRCREQLAVMARSEEKPQPAPKSSWTWDWRWMAATAAVLIVVSAWGFSWNARRSARFAASNESSQPPLLALSQPDQAPNPRTELPVTPSLTSPSPNTTPAPAAEPRRTAPAARNEPNEKSPASLKDQKTAPAPAPGGRAYTNSQELDKSRQSGNLAPQAGGAQLQDSGSPAVPASPRAATAASAQPAAPAAPKANDAIAAEKKQLQTAEAKAGEPAAATLNALKSADQSGSVQTSEQRSDRTLVRTPDAKILWRITTGSFVERTTDGGATWHGQLPDSGAELTTGSAPSGKVCWLVGRNGVILLTKDATTWKKIPPPVPADFTAVTAKSASSATIMTADGQKFVTTDSGKKWKPAP